MGVAGPNRFHASRGTPSTALQSGSLLVFPSPWSSTTVRWSVPAFPLWTPGVAPPLRQCSLSSLPHPPGHEENK